MKNILDVLKEKILICDGAMGTMLYLQVPQPQVCYESLNIHQPKLVESIHRQYLDAGADILETNSFGANITKLAKYGHEKDVFKINAEAARLARRVAAKSAYVAGSIGPLSAQEPDLTTQQIYEIYKEQILGLAEGGVDLFILETFSKIEHIKIAISACKKEASLPVVAQMAFLEGNRIGLGDSVQIIAQELIRTGADVVGANCGNGPRHTLDIINALSNSTDAFISAQPNAGYPQIVDGRTMYLTTPEYFAEYAKKFAQAGANIIGGCCGTTPEHIRLIAKALKGKRPYIRKRSEGFIEATREKQGEPDKKEISVGIKVVVELMPPKTADTNKLIDTAVMLKEKGAKVLSFPENPLARARMSSIAAAGIVKQKTNLDTIFHYTCRDRSLIGLQSDLLGACALGLTSVLAVTGDPVSLGTNPKASSVFDVDSIRLVKLISDMKKEFGLNLRTGVAFNPNFKDIGPQTERLKRKIDAGAEFAMTQPMFEIDKIAEMAKKTKSLGIPVFVGILPLVSRKNAEFLHNEVPGMQIPDAIRSRMNIEDKQKAKEEGMSIALELIEGSKSFVDGFYLISPMHLYEISGQILEKIEEKQ